MAKFVLQMDALHHLQPEGDTSVALGLAIQARGHELFFCSPHTLVWQSGALSAELAPLRLADKARAWYQLGALRRRRLDEMDCLLIRQDPPFDMAYITNLHLLESLARRVLVVNAPSGIAAAPEKLLALKLYEALEDFLPPTLIARDKDALTRFRAEHKDIVLKPLYGSGGAGVFRVRPRDDNFHAMVEQALQQSPLPIMAQRYLPAIARGDKRVLLVDGEPAGAVNRLPPAGDVRANLHIGGRAEKARVDATDRKMAAALRPFLQSLGIWFAGLDVIGGLLTEINVTSPTGVRELKRLSGEDVAARLIGWIEQKLAE